MLIESYSKYLLKKTRAKAKMIEYNVPVEQQIYVEPSISDLFLIAVAAIGNISVAVINDNENCDSIILEYKSELEFASIYLDAYFNSDLDVESNEYFILLGAVAYFLCDIVGSAKVLLNKLDVNNLELNTNGFDKALALLMKDQFHYKYYKSNKEEYDQYLHLIHIDFVNFYKTGIKPNYEILNSLRKIVYDNGTDLELLLIDAFYAIYKLKINHSAITLLPRYVGLDKDALSNILFKGNIVKDLWASQRLLGEKGVYNGNSSVIQMPTSSGKTKSISLTIAIAFLSERTKMVVIVAPFRALCREISYDLEKDFKYDSNIHINELSDVLQPENIFLDLNERAIIIATPEKLIYLLRQRPELSHMFGLIVFDEGHLFDEPNRGVTYELLMSTIKSIIDETVQKILISAIIPNGAQINGWLNGATGVVISDNNIKSSQKAIAFTDWNMYDHKNYGNLYFINPENPDEQEFYVPKLISIENLEKLPRERKLREFPEVDFKKAKVEHNDVAIFYALTLCKNGGVAIFCGKKESANNILKRILEISSRGFSIKTLVETSSVEEVIKISRLIKENYGEDNIYYASALVSAFVHHASIANGIKVSIEYAMRKEYIHFIICTSTLAQGVNLPIRYLIISNMYQGKDIIRVRDFHNLIGRAGRSGLYTEGSILLTETFVYNNRKSKYSRAKYSWEQYKKFIDNNNSEACSSRLLLLIRDYQIKYPDCEPFEIPINDIINIYYSDNENFIKHLNNYVANIQQHFPQYIQEVIDIIDQVLSMSDAIESYLMSYLYEDTWEQCSNIIREIIRNTLAYHLANEDEKAKLINLFESIGQYCINKVPSPNDRYMYSRALLNVEKMLYINKWVDINLDSIKQQESTKDLFTYIFPLLSELLRDKFVKKLENINSLLVMALMWIRGDTYADILAKVREDNLCIYSRNRLKLLELDDVIKICDNILNYNLSIILSAVNEVISSKIDETEDVLKLFRNLGNELKYGLKSGLEIIFYEIGFCDRVISQELAHLFSDEMHITTRAEAKMILKIYEDKVLDLLSGYPSYYVNRFDNL